MPSKGVSGQSKHRGTGWVMMWRSAKMPRTAKVSERAAALYGDDFGYYSKKSRMSDRE